MHRRINGYPRDHKSGKCRPKPFFGNLHKSAQFLIVKLKIKIQDIKAHTLVICHIKVACNR